MNSFLRRTVPTAFLAGGILLGGAGAAGAQLPVDGLASIGGAQGTALLDRTVSMLTSAGGDADTTAAADLQGGGLAGLGGGVVPTAAGAADEASGAVAGATETVEDVAAVTGQVEQAAAESGVASVQTQAAAQACPGGDCPTPPPPPAPPAPPECPGCEPPVDCCEPTTTVTTAPPAETTTTVMETTTTPEPIVQQELPRTGSTVAPWVAAGAGLLLAGGALLGISARKGALRRS